MLPSQASIPYFARHGNIYAAHRGAAGTGALVGQALGGNTESTLIGAAVGGVAGALIGESMKKPGYCIYKNKYGKTYEAPCP